MAPDADEEFYDKFLGTPELEAWDAFMDTARAAIDEGAETVTVPTEFIALILPDLGTPLNFAALRAAWNRICDAENRPDLKKPDLSPLADNDISDDEPF